MIGKAYAGMGSQFVSGMMGKKQEQSNFVSEQELNIQRQREEMKQREREQKERMRQQQRQSPPQRVSPPREEQFDNNKLFPNKPQENYKNAYHPVNLNPGPPSGLIPSNDPRPVINKSQEVNNILKQLHDEVETELESSITASANERLLSETTISESGTKRRRKKKPMMVIT